MLSLLQTSLRFIFDNVIAPDAWTLSEPDPLKGTGGIGQTGRWLRTMQEIPCLSNKLHKANQPGILNSDYVIQYRCMFRFPGNLKYDELPLRRLTDILEYCTFVIQTHPDLLTSSPGQIQAMLNWEYPHVDPCLYPTVGSAQDDLSVRELSVNSFLPVVEMAGSDWLVTLVWSIEVKIEGSLAAYRNYFSSVLTQVTQQPNLTGGQLSGRYPIRVYLGLRDYESGTYSDAPAFTPQPQLVSGTKSPIQPTP